MASHTESLDWRAVFAFGLASLLTIVLGAVVMAQAGIPLGIWVRNPIAWLLAGVVALLLASRGWLGAALAPVAPIIIPLSLIGTAQEGVHRWLDIGPVQLNAATLILPAAIAAFPRTPATVAIPTFAIIAALLAWQPDLSQLAGFALASLILFTRRFGLKGALGALILSIAALALCLYRPDPLLPVAHVEGIFALASSLSPGIGIAMAVSLAAAALSPLLLWKSPAGLALAAYFSATALAVLFGAYPAPLAGYGLSFVIGWQLGFACLSVRGPARRIP